MTQDPEFLDEQDKFYDLNQIDPRDPDHVQLYGYVPQFPQDKKHFIRPKGKVNTNPDAYNFEQFQNETINDARDDEEEEPKPITTFVPKKKIATKEQPVYAGPNDYLQRTPKPPTNFMAKNKQKYSDGRKNAFTKVG